MNESEEKDNKNNISQNEINNKDEEKDLKKDISIEEKLKDTHDKLLRTMAEMENQRRRFEKERDDAFEFGGFNFARESLSILDNVERAISSFKSHNKLRNDEDINKIIEGVEILKKYLFFIFKKNQIESIDCIDKKFDPNFHQAMLEVENSEKESGIVVQEIQKGYMMKDRLLRPSLVGVTKKKQEKDQKK